LSELRKLLLSEQRADEGLLTDLLKGLALLDQTKRQVVLTPAGLKLAGRARVLLVLAGQHAWKLLGGELEGDASISVKEIESQTKLIGNTLRPILKDLKDENLIEAAGKGRYRIPVHALPVVPVEIAARRPTGTRSGKH